MTSCGTRVPGLPNILEDVKTQAGVTTTTTFVYGLGLISTTDNAGSSSYYLSDGLGSTTQLTDSSGAVTDGYNYDVFGAPKTATGTTANDFRFTGQQDDSNANRGLYYLRARAYDPALGRFLQRDPVPFVQSYAYAGNNPGNLEDPSGRCVCWDDIASGTKEKAGAAGDAIASGSAAAAQAVAPAAYQCLVWGIAGAFVGGGPGGAVAGCATGVASYLLTEYGPNNAYWQCAVWGVGGAATGGGKLATSVALGAGGCIGGVTGFFEDSSRNSQCLAWALGGAVSFVTRGPIFRAWASAVGSAAGAASTVFGSGMPGGQSKE